MLTACALGGRDVDGSKITMEKCMQCVDACRYVTANTISDEQLHEIRRNAEAQCREPRIQYVSIEVPNCVVDLIAANWALGNFDNYVDDAGYYQDLGGTPIDRTACRYNGRIRCAKIWHAHNASKGDHADR